MPTCFITGANRGIGLELVRQYAADGWHVVATCRRPEWAEALRAVAGDVHIHALDVTDFAQIEAAARAMNGAAIDVLINNAGVYGPRSVPFDGVDYGAWANVLRVNTMAPLKISAVFAENVARSQQKRIVALTSLLGSIADNNSGGSYIYRTSKAALNAAMKTLAVDLRARGIAVAVIHPGWVRTDMGGSGAMIDPFESVAGMREVIAGLNLENSGRFFNYDNREIPW
jgi:NAD(P)-dependent dehydrogenase (short-subunit alcohol dehydrogenase family)